ncbi:hypothetical protein Btru_065151 [Bulinus truncatus]|nr:hypothetical protein Btru_065151 [Bulinus truncatus]
MFSKVDLECKHGKIRKSRSTGERPNQRSAKLGCQAFIKLASKKIAGVWKIIVTDSCLQHNNHIPSIEAVSVLPVKRRIEVNEVVTTLAKCTSISVKDFREIVKESTEDFKQKYEELETLFNLWQRVDDAAQDTLYGGASISHQCVLSEERDAVASETFNETTVQLQSTHVVPLIVSCVKGNESTFFIFTPSVHSDSSSFNRIL